MRYDPMLIQPFRDELTRIGFQELKTPEAVDAAVEEKQGTTLVVVNSVCGCAAGKARPGIAIALRQSAVRPDRLATVFAGGDRDPMAEIRWPRSRVRPDGRSAGSVAAGRP